MKRLIKISLRAVWRAMSPIRKRMQWAVERIIRNSLRPTQDFLAQETYTLMDHLVRELVRLQQQVDHLEQTLEDLASRRAQTAASADHRKAG